jgi:hypothetical protein
MARFSPKEDSPTAGPRSQKPLLHSPAIPPSFSRSTTSHTIHPSLKFRNPRPSGFSMPDSCALVLLSCAAGFREETLYAEKRWGSRLCAACANRCARAAWLLSVPRSHLSCGRSYREILTAPRNPCRCPFPFRCVASLDKGCGLERAAKVTGDATLSVPNASRIVP